MSTEDFKTLFTIIASASAAFFFIWKILAGWLVVNVQISIETNRQRSTEVEDLLAIKIVLIKGNTDTLQIKDIKAIVRTENEKNILKEFSFPEIHKLFIKNDLLQWGKLNSDRRNIS